MCLHYEWRINGLEIQAGDSVRYADVDSTFSLHRIGGEIEMRCRFLWGIAWMLMRHRGDEHFVVAIRNGEHHDKVPSDPIHLGIL